MNSEFWEDVNIQYITSERVVRVVRIKDLFIEPWILRRNENKMQLD